MAIEYKSCDLNSDITLPTLMLAHNDFTTEDIHVNAKIHPLNEVEVGIVVLIFIVSIYLTLKKLKSSFKATLTAFIVAGLCANYLFYPVFFNAYIQHLLIDKKFNHAAQLINEHQQNMRNSLASDKKTIRHTLSNTSNDLALLEALHHQTMALGVKHYVSKSSNKEVDELIQYWPNYTSYYSKAHYFIASALTLGFYYDENHKPDLALKFASDVYRTRPKFKYAKKLYLKALFEQGKSQISQGDFANALNLLTKLPFNWQPEIQSLTIAYTADKLATYSVSTQKSGFNAEPLQGVVDNFITLEHWQKNLNNKQINPYVDCHLADLYTYIAKYELERKNIHGALKLVTNANTLVKNNPTTHFYLVKTYQALASKALHQNNFDHANTYLKRALAYDDSNTLKCELSWVQGNQAMAFIANNKLTESSQILAKAKANCPNMADLNTMEAKLTLAKALNAMRFGNYHKAKQLLAPVHYIKSPEVYQDAKRHLELVSMASRFIKQYRKSSALKTLPKVTGAICRVGKHACETVELYHNGQRIGAAKPYTHELQFFGKQADEFIVFTSHSKSRYYNEVTNYKGKSAIGFLDNNKDRRADWKYHVVNEKLVSSTQLSGNISIKFFAALSDTSQDLFSKPDLLIAVRKNNRLIGVTETQHNTYLPKFNIQASISYKHGDRVRLDLYDDDSIGIGNLIFKERYERMGHLTLNKLPKSGFHKVSKHIGLYLEVAKSHLPEGMSLNTEGLYQESSPFESDLSFANPEMTQYLIASYDAQMHTTWTELAGSIGLAELAMLPVRNVTLFQRLILTVLSHEAAHHTLTQQNSDAI